MKFSEIPYKRIEKEEMIASLKNAVEALKAAQDAGDADKVKLYTEILYNQALLVEGLPIDDPVAYAQAVTQLMK